MSEADFYAYETERVLSSCARLARLANAHTYSVPNPLPGRYEGYYRTSDSVVRLHFNERDRLMEINRLERINVSDPYSLSAVAIDDLRIDLPRWQAVVTRTPGSKINLRRALERDGQEYELLFAERNNQHDPMKVYLPSWCTVGHLRAGDDRAGQVLTAALSLTTADRYVTSIATAADIAESIKDDSTIPDIYEAADTATHYWRRARTMHVRTALGTHVLQDYQPAGHVMRLVSIDTDDSMQGRLDAAVAGAVEPSSEIPLTQFNQPERSYGVVLRVGEGLMSLLAHGNQPVVEGMYTPPGVRQWPAHLFLPADWQLRLDRLSGRCQPLSADESRPYCELLEASLS
jgi:hypothetical protein